MEAACKCSYVVVAGGGTRALAYLGIIDALESKLGDRWRTHYREGMRGFVGASAGSIVALCLTLQLTGKDVRDAVQPFLENIRMIAPNPDISSMIHSYGMDTGNGILTLVRDILRRGNITEDVTFERMHQLTRREFACTGLNINTNAVHTFDRHTRPNMSVVDAIRISTSVPLLYTPVELDGDLYIDGALGCNMPDCYPRSECMLWCLGTPERSCIAGWADYVHSVMQIGMCAQRAQERSMRDECAFVVHVRLPDAILNGPGVNLQQTTTTTESLISCGYAACCDALSQGGLYKALTALTIAAREKRQQAAAKGACTSKS